MTTAQITRLVSKTEQLQQEQAKQQQELLRLKQKFDRIATPLIPFQEAGWWLPIPLPSGHQAFLGLPSRMISQDDYDHLIHILGLFARGIIAPPQE